MNNNLDNFGEIFIDEVRDNTIESFEKMINGIMKGLTAKEVQEKILGFNDEQKRIALWLISKAWI